MDHLGIRKFMVLGYCIGGPSIWNLLRRAPERVVAAVLAQPSGHRPELPDQFYQNNIKGWGPALCERRSDITMATVDAFLNQMYRANADFVFTVTRDFVRDCRTPLLVLPDDIPAHPFAVAMESAMLASTERAGQLVSVERAEGAGPASGTTHSRVPEGTPAAQRRTEAQAAKAERLLSLIAEKLPEGGKRPAKCCKGLRYRRPPHMCDIRCKTQSVRSVASRGRLTKMARGSAQKSRGGRPRPTMPPAAPAPECP
jgi:hypothetical protein